VPLDEPTWWYGRSARASVLRTVLAPAGHVYGAVARARFRKVTAHQSALPVICVGNLTAGGTGKTPLSIYIADLLLSLGEKPVFLTRGYGGGLAGPHRVDRAIDSADEVGDEPLLLARTAPTVVSRDRVAGAQAIATADRDASVIIMDDGLQNPSLAKDLTLAVVDGARGIGNGKVIPAGPLRASLKFQLGLVDAMVVNGGNVADVKAQFGRHLADVNLTWLQASVVPRGDVSWLKDARVFAYAGIGNPQRFFETLTSHGAFISGTAEFRDHQLPSAGDASALLREAREKRAILVTTEKDFVRLPSTGHPHIMELKAQSRTLPIGLTLSAKDDNQLRDLIMAALKERRAA
jgi:tetraacyldisaccharide 4'-kinase